MNGGFGVRQLSSTYASYLMGLQEGWDIELSGFYWFWMEDSSDGSMDGWSIGAGTYLDDLKTRYSNWRAKVSTRTFLDKNTPINTWQLLGHGIRDGTWQPLDMWWPLGRSVLYDVREGTWWPIDTWRLLGWSVSRGATLPFVTDDAFGYQWLFLWAQDVFDDRRF